MLKQRVITALGGISILLACVWFDRPLPWFTVLVAVWGLAAAFEFYGMVRHSGARPQTLFGLVCILLFILSPHVIYPPFTSTLLTSAAVLSLIWLLFRRNKEAAFAGWAWTVAGILYIGWLLSHLVALRMLDDGRNWVFFAFFVTFGSDTAAYFIGRALGRHRLAPQVSPGKTGEGFIGGTVGAIVVSLLFLLPSPLYLPLPCWHVILLGLAVSVFGQLGDLVESLLKRNMGVKDSGNLLPGHGGALDRIDSVIFAGIVVYYYVTWIAV